MRLLRLLRREDGISLIMAVGVLGVLSLTGTTLVFYSESNSRSASYSRENNDAYVLSEAGLNEMMAVLSKKENNPMDPNILAQKTSTYDGGTVTWSGTLDTMNAVWNVTSVGKTNNPTGAGAAQASRKMTAKIPIQPVIEQPLGTPAWNYVYATRTGNTCDELLSNSVVFSVALFVEGNLCLASGSAITGGPLVVKGTVDMAASNNYIGTSSSPIGEVHIGGGCQWYNQHWHPDTGDGHPFCSSVDKVYATIRDQTPPPISPPVADWDGWYQNAMPGPKYDCNTKSGTPPVFDNDTVRNNSVPTFNLTPSASYTCKFGLASNPIGELSWDVSTRTLTVRGTIFIDGGLKIEAGGQNPPLNAYNGQATIYLSGHFHTANKNKLCAVISGSSCHWSNWNTNDEMLTIVANGPGGVTGVNTGNSIQLNNETLWQGALFATNAIQIGADSKVEGPMIGSQVIVGSGVALDAFQFMADSPAGMPGNPTVYAQPNPPQLYGG